MLQPCTRAAQRRQQQGVTPDREATEQTGDHAAATGPAPVQGGNQRGRELRHCGEGQQSGSRQVFRVGRQPVVDVGHQRQRHDGHPAHGQHQLRQVIALFQPQPADTQQRGHHQVIADHGGQRHRGHDHHAGCRGESTDEGQQGDAAVPVRQRQREHPGIGGAITHDGHVRARCHDGQHRHADDGQVDRHHPARALQVIGLLALHHADLELARQAEHGAERQHGLRQKARREPMAELVHRQLHRGHQTRPTPQRVTGQSHEGHQLDQRLQRDRQHHAVMVLGRIDAARTEQDREHRQQRRAPQRAVYPIRRQRRRCMPAEHAIRHGHGLELQRDVRHHGSHRDDRHQRRQAMGLAEPRADEVGDGSDVALAHDAHDPLHQAEAEQEQQDRSQVDRQVGQAVTRRRSDRTVERPRGAIHRQREAVDDGTQFRLARIERPAITRVGNHEQHAHIQERYQQQQPTLYQAPLPASERCCLDDVSRAASTSKNLRRHRPVAACAAAGRAGDRAAPCLYPGTVNVTMVR